MVLLTRKDGLGESRIHRELSHPPPHLRQLSLIIESPERIQRIEGADEGVARRRIQEVESNEVVDSERFEHEHDHAEVRTLDLRDRVLVELVRVGVLRVESEALPRPDSSCTSCSLSCSCARALKTMKESVQIIGKMKRGRTGVTTRDSIPERGLYEFCLTNPGSIT
jgi:hypothetical protein